MEADDDVATPQKNGGDVFDDAALFVSDATTDEEMVSDHDKTPVSREKGKEVPVFHRVDDTEAQHVDLS